MPENWVRRRCWIMSWKVFLSFLQFKPHHLESLRVPNPPQVALWFLSTLKIRVAPSQSFAGERKGGLHNDALQLSAAEEVGEQACGQRPSRGESQASPKCAHGRSHWVPPAAHGDT